jgi:hypothetical protein
VATGQYAKSIQALCSLGLAENSQQTLNAMITKHPQKPPPTLPSQPPPPSLIFTIDQVKDALLSFNEGTAPGPSSMKANFLKDASSAPNSTRRERYMSALTKLINILAQGKAPISLQPFLCGATLHAGLKPKGGYRPIAIGETLTRLVSKCFSSALASEAANFFSPHQLGVKVKGGCESVIHAISAILNAPTSAIPIEERCIVQVDFENAFNNVDRTLFLAETREHFPALSSWAEYSYGSSSYLFYRETQILSCTGARQGDPIASLLYALGLNPTVKKINQLPSIKANLWIMDDGTVSAPLSSLRQVVSILETDGPQSGLFLNKSKCFVWCGHHDPLNLNPLACGIPCSDPRGLHLLGSPIGSTDFMQEVINQRIDKIEEIVHHHLPTLEDPQVQFCLLRSCLSLPKITYSLR